MGPKSVLNLRTLLVASALCFLLALSWSSNWATCGEQAEAKKEEKATPTPPPPEAKKEAKPTPPPPTEAKKEEKAPPTPPPTEAKKEAKATPPVAPEAKKEEKAAPPAAPEAKKEEKAAPPAAPEAKKEEKAAPPAAPEAKKEDKATPAAESKKDDDDKPAEDKPVNPDALTEEQLAVLKKDGEQHEFQAEVYRLMDIIINSLYGKTEVFLRELVSNSADALEKMRFLSIEDDTALGTTPDLQIVLEYDSDAKTITFADTGVGMTKQDLINNLGTVAKSGTANFLEAVAHGGDVNLIGQFGVGFYSAFLVADKVTVVSKNNADDQHIWESTADASFTVAKDPRGNTLGRGTRITLHLKEDSTDFLKKSTLTDLLKKYSQFVNFPIYLKVQKTVSEEVPLEPEEVEAEEEKEKEKDEDEVEVEEGEEKKEKEKKKTTKTVKKNVTELKHINQQKPIWMRPKDEITDEQYNEFYRSLVKDDHGADPFTHIHFAAEGEIEFRAILYIPSRMSRDPYSQYFTKKHDIKLFVRRVLVSEQFEDIVPSWLSFVKGVIDSDDLPLKVDRESVSQIKVIKVISKRVTRKVLDVLRKISSDSDESQVTLTSMEEKAKEEGRVKTEEEGGEEVVDYTDEEEEKRSDLTSLATKYNNFWMQFGRNLKLGCVDDDGGNRSKIAKLLRYFTSKSTEKPVSLQTVFDRLVEGQSAIYYMTGESTEKMMKSPLLQGFLDKGVEVLLLSDAVDDSCISAMQDFEGKKLTSIEKGDVALDQTDEEKEYFKKLKSYYRPLTKWWKTKLTAKGVMYSRVQLSNRLVDAPVGVAASQYGTTAFAENIYRYQTFVDTTNMMAGKFHRILEINPQHALIREMRRLHQEDENSTVLDTMADDLAEAASVASGFTIDNPQSIAGKLYDLFARKLEVSLDKAPKIDLSEFEVDETAATEADKEEGQMPFGDLSSFLQSANLEKDASAGGDDDDMTMPPEDEDDDFDDEEDMEDDDVDEEDEDVEEEEPSKADVKDEL